MTSQSDKAIQFFFQSKKIALKDRTKLKVFMSDLLKKEGRRPRHINIIFCSDRELLKINQDYLKHDYYTDIITFDLSSSGSALEAEIYISVDRVRDNAQKLGNTISKELLRVLFHGLLHLCGYGDKTKKDIKIMRQKEQHYIYKYKS